MSYHCELQTQATQPTLFLRTRTAVSKLPEVLGRSYGSIAQFLAEVGEQPTGPPFVGYFSMDMDDLEVEIGFPVAREISGKGEIQSGKIPAGRSAVCLYKGPYSEIEPAYAALQVFLEKEGLQATGVSYEFYLNDPQETPPEELETRIIFPLVGEV